MEPTNSPVGPGISISGMNARIVVNVDPRSGTARCAEAFGHGLAAGSRYTGTPSVTSCTVMMAVSISSPNATIKPVTEI